MTVLCEYCQTAPTPAGIRVCHACLTRFEEALDIIPDLLADAQTTLALQHQNATAAATNTSAPASEKAPINLDLQGHLDQLTGTLARLTVMLTGRPLRHTGDTALRARIVRANTNHYRTTPNAAATMWDLINHVHNIYTLVDRPADTIHYGPCQTPACNGAYIGHHGTPHAECRHCRATINTTDHLTTKLETAWHTPAPLLQCVNALKALGHPIPYTTAKSWVSRGHLTTHYVDKKGRPAYTLQQLIEARARRPKPRTTKNVTANSGTMR